EGRIRSPRPSGGRRFMGGKSSNDAGVHPAGYSLVPRQPAISEAARYAGAAADEPLSARLGHFDVSRNPGLDADDRLLAGLGMGGAQHFGLSDHAGHRPVR